MSRATELANMLLAVEIPQRDAVQMQPMNVVTVIAELAAQASATATMAGVALTTETEENLPFVLADPLSLYRVLNNLILNAIRHTAAGGRVTISASRHGNDVLVRVDDTGRGIANLQELLQEDAALSHGRLGLWISHRLVKSMGSELLAESQVGRGTSFYFTLAAANL